MQLCCEECLWHLASVPGLIGLIVKVVRDNVTSKLSWDIAAFSHCIWDTFQDLEDLSLSAYSRFKFPSIIAVNFFSFLTIITIFFFLLHFTLLYLQSFPQVNSKQSISSQGLFCNVTDHSSPLGKKINVLFKTTYSCYLWCYRYACCFSDKWDGTGWCPNHFYYK